MKLIFELDFNKKSGYVEKDFFDVVSKNINGLRKEMKISNVECNKVVNGYLFAIEFEPVMPMITYQPIFGCFAGLDVEYPYISNMLWSSIFVTLRPNFCHRVYITP